MKRKILSNLLVAISILVVLALSIPMVTGCRQAKPEEVQPIKVGFAAFRTGLLQEDNRHMERVFQVALAEANGAGGVLGRPVEIVFVDIGNNTPAELSAARDAFIAADVDVIFTSWWLVSKGIEYMLETGAFVIQFGWVSDDWEAWYNVKDKHPYFVQCNRDEEGYGVPWFQALQNPEMITWDYPNKKAAIMMSDFGYTIKQATWWKEEAQRHGWEIVYEDIHPIGTIEFGPQLTRIRELNPSIVFMASNFVQEVIANFNGFIQNPTESLYVVTFAPTKPEFMDALGTKADGVLGTVPTFHYVAGEYTGNNPYYTQMAQRHDFIKEEVATRFGEEPAPGGYHADDAFGVWKQAVEKTGSTTDYDAILEAILATPYVGALGRFAFDRETQASSYGVDKIPIMYYQVRDGVPVTLAIGAGLDVEHDQEFQLPYWLQ